MSLAVDFESLEYAIGGVQPHEVPHVIEQVLPLLERALQRQPGGHTVESLVADLVTGHTQLWVIGPFEGVVITRIVERPAERVLWVEWMAGDTFRKWRDDWHKVQTAFAQAHDCSAVEFNGRRGYRAYEKDYPEFRAVATVYRQELNDGR